MFRETACGRCHIITTDVQVPCGCRAACARPAKVVGCCESSLRRSRSRCSKTVKHRTSMPQDYCAVRREEYVKLSSSSWHSGMAITAGIYYLFINVFVKLNRWPAQVGSDSSTLQDT
ncbi:hypothetical protein E2C01_058258 [Portunus trituberculatus]|uniref:Uncharacterized protein n=1 Tax=Portunus trituberculatus TaxID=210409 RepID=A0A5B7H2Q1_PORTR|nr:hypothetical protein [Portunus trituberculatus]